MRSQLDCHDPWLPRRTFDLKTRAVLPVRMDVANYSRYRDYRLVKSHGLYCSFEREYYDMCRSALLKYKYSSCQETDPLLLTIIIYSFFLI